MGRREMPVFTLINSRVLLLMRPLLSGHGFYLFIILDSGWSLPRTWYGAGMTTKNLAFLMFVSPAKAGVQFRVFKRKDPPMTFRLLWIHWWIGGEGGRRNSDCGMQVKRVEKLGGRVWNFLVPRRRPPTLRGQTALLWSAGSKANR